MKRIICAMAVMFTVGGMVMADELPMLKQGWCLLLGGRYDVFGGDMDVLEPAAGLNIGFGRTVRNRMGFEVELLLDSIHKVKNDSSFWLSDGNRVKFFDQFHFGGILFNLKYYFRDSGKVFPFIKAGGGVYALTGDDTNYSLSGTGYQGGIGAEQYLSEKALLHYGVSYRGITFDKATFDGTMSKLREPVNANVWSIEVGISRFFR